MTEIIFSAVFFVCVGFVIGKLFKGLNPFKLLFGISFGFAVAVALVEANNNWYTALFIIGFLINYGNPFARLSSIFEDFKLHRLYNKSLQQQKSNIEADIEEKVNEATKRHTEKEAKLRQEEERLRREREAFEKNKSRHSQNTQKSKRMTKDEAIEILGLSPGFSLRELKKAYKKEALKYHPDRGVGQPSHIVKLMETEYKKVALAYELLEKS